MSDIMPGEDRYVSKMSDILPKSGSFDNIVELSMDMIAQGFEESTDLKTCNSSSGVCDAHHFAAHEHKVAKAEEHARRARISPRNSTNHFERTARLRPVCASDTSLCQPLNAQALLTHSKGPRERDAHRLQGYFASCLCERDDMISESALPPSHSRWLLGVSFLSFITTLQCVHYGNINDLLAVPLGVGINSVNYWRQPDYSWRRYTDIIFIQFAIPYMSYTAWRECPEPYCSLFFFFLLLGVAFFFNACRLCIRPPHGRWSEFLHTNPESARLLRWSTANHFLLHIFCNVGNAVLFSGLSWHRANSALSSHSLE